MAYQTVGNTRSPIPQRKIVERTSPNMSQIDQRINAVHAIDPGGQNAGLAESKPGLTLPNFKALGKVFDILPYNEKVADSTAAAKGIEAYRKGGKGISGGMRGR